MTAVTRILSTALLVLFSSVSHAVPIVTYDGGTGFATGIQGLSVGGKIYNVAWTTGSYNTIFGAGTPTFLGDEASADAAANAIGAILNGEPAVPQIATGGSEVLWVATAVFGPGLSMFEAEQVGKNADPLPWQRFGDFVGDRNVNHQSPPSFSYLFATFSEVSAAPEPATLALLGLGLAGLGWSRRRK